MSETTKALKLEYTIVKILSSISEALTYFQKQPKIDLIFSDIQMEDGVSFDIFKKIQKRIIVINTNYIRKIFEFIHRATYVIATDAA